MFALPVAEVVGPKASNIFEPRHGVGVVLRWDYLLICLHMFHITSNPTRLEQNRSGILDLSGIASLVHSLFSKRSVDVRAKVVESSAVGPTGIMYVQAWLSCFAPEVAPFILA